VFLGESVVEAMDGRWLGKKMPSTAPRGEGQEDAKVQSIDKIFEKNFRKDKGGKVEGLALGIAGDSCTNVLWRIQHDEMPSDFNPKVWWVVLGMNDLTRMQCSEEIVVLGILRVVEEIHLRKPDARIVINSLLPMINFQPMGDPKMADFADFVPSRRGNYPKREVPPTFRVKGNDDETGDEAAKDEGENRRYLAEEITDYYESLNIEEDIPLRQEHGLRKLQNNDEKRKRAKSKKTKKEREEEEDNATEGPELEKALERKKKLLDAMDKKTRGQVFKDAEKYHPKQPVNPLLPFKRPALPPVWPSVHVINDQLKKFCEKHEQITFFDATPLFASDEGKGGHRLYEELISPRGHPRDKGFKVWEDAIKERLHKMLDVKMEKKTNHAENVSPETKANDEIDNVDESEPPSDNGGEHISDGKEAHPPQDEGNESLPQREGGESAPEESKPAEDNEASDNSQSEEEAKEPENTPAENDEANGNSQSEEETKQPEDKPAENKEEEKKEAESNEGESGENEENKTEEADAEGDEGEKKNE